MLRTIADLRGGECKLTRDRSRVRRTAEDAQLRAILRVLVVSNVRLFQEGLSSVLARQDDIEVVGTTDISHARDRTADLRPDVVLFDATRHDSVEHLKHLVASVPNTKIVALGVTEANDEILALAAAGTAGYVHDSAAAKDVVGVLDRVMRDELLCSPRAAASLYRQVAVLSHSVSSADANGRVDMDLLSRRELQIAHLIERGLSNKQIARELGIEATTVKNHVHHLFEKLNVHRRVEAAARIRANLRSLAAPFGIEPDTLDSPRKAR
jgi:two-component system nitrate/nitrite response regulator NarL